jgi:hypothetical protein
MKIWKITVHFEERDLNYTVTKYPTIRDDRCLFIDERTGLSKNFPYNKISIEEVRQ